MHLPYSATNDADKALKITQYCRIHHSSTGKVQVVWNAVRRSTKAADFVAEICGKLKFLFP